jgi:hypothetical protein
MELLTKEGNARRIRKMQALPVFAEILRAPHQLTHLLEDGDRACWDLVPCSLKPVDWCSTECRDDGGQRRVVIQCAAFLFKSQYS